MKRRDAAKAGLQAGANTLSTSSEAVARRRPVRPLNQDGLEAFKNERNYIAQSGHHKTTVAAMDWAAIEIEMLRGLMKQRDLALIAALEGWNDARAKLDAILETRSGTKFGAM